MSTILATSLLNIIGNSKLSQEDLEALKIGLAKLQQPTATNCKPKKIQYQAPMPTLHECIESIRTRFSTPKQVELA